MKGILGFFGNILWLVLGGILSAIFWAIAGLLLCITIIGIPFGVQCFKIAGLVIWPFGRTVEIGGFGAGGLIMNIIWAILFGWELFINHIVCGVIMCITIIGIPFGLQHFKFAMLSFIPFGATISQT